MPTEPLVLIFKCLRLHVVNGAVLSGSRLFFSCYHRSPFAVKGKYFFLSVHIPGMGNWSTSSFWIWEVLVALITQMWRSRLSVVSRREGENVHLYEMRNLAVWRFIFGDINSCVACSYFVLRAYVEPGTADSPHGNPTRQSQVVDIFCELHTVSVTYSSLSLKM